MSPVRECRPWAAPQLVRLASAVLTKALQDLFMLCRERDRWDVNPPSRAVREYVNAEIEAISAFLRPPCWAATLTGTDEDAMADRAEALRDGRVNPFQHERHRSYLINKGGGGNDRRYCTAQRRLELVQIGDRWVGVARPSSPPRQQRPADGSETCAEYTRRRPMKIGDRVIVLEDFPRGSLADTPPPTVVILGAGRFVGNECPTEATSPRVAAVMATRRTNPKYILDDGQVVWGCEFPCVPLSYFTDHWADLPRQDGNLSASRRLHCGGG